MTRYPDWQLRLEAFVREHNVKPFAWGSNDCAVFAADAVEAITGEVLRPDLRGLDTRQTAVALRDGGGVRGIASSALGAPIPAVVARIGDMVVVMVNDRESLAICNGGTAIAAGPDGLVAVPMSFALAAWRVG